MCQIELKLYASLRLYVGGAASVRVDIEPDQTVRQVLDRLGVPVARVPPASETGEALRRAWQGALERFATPPTLGLADGR